MEWRGREAQEKGDIHIYIYMTEYFLLMYGKDPHNIVKKFSNKKKKKEEAQMLRWKRRQLAREQGKSVPT